MSYSIASESALEHEELAAHTIKHDAPGQRHDRIQVAEQKASDMAGSNAPEITTTQRMVSATWGSIITSLLGTEGPVRRGAC